MLWVGLQFVIVVFPDHTHLLFDLVCTQHILFSQNSIPTSFFSLDPDQLALMKPADQDPHCIIQTYDESILILK